MNSEQSTTQLQALIKLTRWQEHVTWGVPLTLLGSLLALQNAGEGAVVDWRLLTVIIANTLVVAYAFMINDIEDAPDDALDPERAKRNPITSNELSKTVGYTACAITALFTLVFYWTGGTTVFIIGVITLILSHLYSWRPVRLKKWPVTDIVSHSLMLSGLLFIAGYYVYHDDPGAVWFVAACATLFSVYGQLYNQLRDYDMDKAAGLKNTAIILGEQGARVALALSVGGSALCLLAAIVLGVFPVWLLIPLGIGAIISFFFRTGTDLRGSDTAELGSKLQMQGIVIMNVTMFVWLGAVLLQQWGVV